MAAIRTGLHISTVTLGTSHRVCAIWRVRDHTDAPPTSSTDTVSPCALPTALLLPRRGAEQDWAVETVLAALRERGGGDGPSCATLSTSADGIRLTSLRRGLCDADLLELARTGLGEGQREWAALAARDPAAFHAAAPAPYVLRRHAAAFHVRRPDGGGHARLVHRRSEEVLRAFTAGPPGQYTDHED
ncbi:hypothetical protein [Streptomyces sp. TRM64462]|uniref:hypothetical protein n=1 Tax=Streptomyces sp. TRM64462 TaxID=2741726 RepID=UPI001585F959|nr:hypothetical protein [Streptomyces sp. TRM64462]